MPKITSFGSEYREVYNPRLYIGIDKTRLVKFTRDYLTVASDLKKLPITHWGWVIHIRQENRITLVLTMAALPFCAKQSSKPMLAYQMSHKFQWSVKQNITIVIEENAFEKSVSKMSSILSRSHFKRNLPLNLLQLIMPLDTLSTLK